MLRYVFALMLACVCSSCAFYMPDPPCPAPPSAKPKIVENFSCWTPTVAPTIPNPCRPLPLYELVDLALENSPLTRQAWFNAKAAAADVGTARGAYLPPITFGMEWMKEQFLETDLGLEFRAREEYYDFNVSTSYLLFDFGGRNANLRHALSALTYMHWVYNWEVQTVMINVIQSYYNYVNALGVYEADLATVQDNKQSLEAATMLTKLGVTSLSDQLQVETALLQSLVILEQDKGSLNVAYATLIQSLGLAPDTPLKVCCLPDAFPIEEICCDMNLLLEAAKRNRADLGADRAAVLQNRANIQSARSKFFPNLTTAMSAGKAWINSQGPDNEFAIEFDITYPFFNSFADINALRKAQAQLQASQAQLDNDELNAFLAVLTDYYDFFANKEILKYSEKYLEVALENQKVAYANYLAGVTTIIDLMTANNSLNQARVQLADAKTNFLTSLANLAYDTGGLTLENINCCQTVSPEPINPPCSEVECIE